MPQEISKGSKDFWPNLMPFKLQRQISTRNWWIFVLPTTKSIPSSLLIENSNKWSSWKTNWLPKWGKKRLNCIKNRSKSKNSGKMKSAKNKEFFLKCNWKQMRKELSSIPRKTVLKKLIWSVLKMKSGNKNTKTISSKYHKSNQK